MILPLTTSGQGRTLPPLYRALGSCLLAAGLFCFFPASSQDQMQRYFVDNQRCSALMPAAPELETAYFIDSNKLYMARTETMANGQSWIFGTVVLHLIHDSLTMADDDALGNFVEYYKSTLPIAESRGIKKSGGVFARANASTLSDVWTVHSGQTITMQAMAQGNRMAILFIHGDGSFPNQTIQRSFFSGFRFPTQ